jgi:hypothetical protein
MAINLQSCMTSRVVLNTARAAAANENQLLERRTEAVLVIFIL